MSTDKAADMTFGLVHEHVCKITKCVLPKQNACHLSRRHLQKTVGNFHCIQFVSFNEELTAEACLVNMLVCLITSTYLHQSQSAPLITESLERKNWGQDIADLLSDCLNVSYFCHWLSDRVVRRAWPSPNECSRPRVMCKTSSPDRLTAVHSHANNRSHSSADCLCTRLAIPLKAEKFSEEQRTNSKRPPPSLFRVHIKCAYVGSVCVLIECDTCSGYLC